MSNSGPSSPQENAQLPQRHNTPNKYNKNRSNNQQSEMHYTDLRELLNERRQNETKIGGGPPSDPKYNYLSDPMRDDTQKVETNFGRGRFSQPNQRYNSNRQYTNYNPGRGRGRGNFENNGPKNYNKPGYSNKRDEYVRDNNSENYYQNAESGKFTREWDQGKESYHQQDRNKFPSRYNNPHKNPDHHKYENREGAGGPSNFKPPFKQQQQNDRPNQYKGPPHKFNPNFNRGGGSQRNYERKKYNKNVDPVNIKVEYSVEDGSRKCTTQDVKLEKSWNKNSNNKKDNRLFHRIHVECEENWDDIDVNDNKGEQTVVTNQEENWDENTINNQESESKSDDQDQQGIVQEKSDNKSENDARKDEKNVEEPIKTEKNGNKKINEAAAKDNK